MIVVTAVLVGSLPVEVVTVPLAAARGGPGWPPAIEHAASVAQRHMTRPATVGLDCFRIRLNMPNIEPNGCPNP